MISNRNIGNQIPENRLPRCRTNGRSYTAVQFGSKDHCNFSSKLSCSEKKTLWAHIIDFLLAPFRRIIACIWGNRDEVPTTPQQVPNHTQPTKSNSAEDSLSSKEEPIQPTPKQTISSHQRQRKKTNYEKERQEWAQDIQELRNGYDKITQIEQNAAKKGLKIPLGQGKHLLEAADVLEKYNKVVKREWLDPAQDLEYMDEQLEQLRLENQIAEDERRHYLQSRNRQ